MAPSHVLALTALLFASAAEPVMEALPVNQGGGQATICVAASGALVGGSISCQINDGIESCTCPAGATPVASPICKRGEAAPRETPAIAKARLTALSNGGLWRTKYEGQRLCVVAAPSRLPAHFLSDQSGPYFADPNFTRVIVCVDPRGAILANARGDYDGNGKVKGYLCPADAKPILAPACGPGRHPPQRSAAADQARVTAIAQHGNLLGAHFEGRLLCVPAEGAYPAEDMDNGYNQPQANQ